MIELWGAGVGGGGAGAGGVFANFLFADHPGLMLFIRTP